MSTVDSAQLTRAVQGRVSTCRGLASWVQGVRGEVKDKAMEAVM